MTAPVTKVHNNENNNPSCWLWIFSSWRRKELSAEVWASFFVHLCEEHLYNPYDFDVKWLLFDIVTDFI